MPTKTRWTLIVEKKCIKIHYYSCKNINKRNNTYRIYCNVQTACSTNRMVNKIQNNRNIKLHTCNWFSYIYSRWVLYFCIKWPVHFIFFASLCLFCLLLTIWRLIFIFSPALYLQSVSLPQCCCTYRVRFWLWRSYPGVKLLRSVLLALHQDKLLFFFLKSLSVSALLFRLILL